MFICFTLGSETVKNIQNNIVLLDIISIFDIVVGIFIVIVIFCQTSVRYVLHLLCSKYYCRKQQLHIFFSQHLDNNFSCSTDIHSNMFYNSTVLQQSSRENCGRLTLYKIHRTLNCCHFTSPPAPPDAFSQ